MKTRTYIPAQGDLVWLDFNPQAGHEQAGRRPGVILSPRTYNARVGLALVCPVTSKTKGYPFEVSLPEGLPIQGVAIADQLKSMDWQVRHAEFIAKLDSPTVEAALQKARTLLSRDQE